MRNKTLISMIVIIITFVFACQKKEFSKKTYFPNGKLKSLVNYKNEAVLDSSLFYYFKNGKLSEKATYRNDTIYYYEYYQNGNLSVKSQFLGPKNIKNIGWFIRYSDSGSVKDSTEYLLIDGKEYLNQKIVYDKGEILRDSSIFYRMKLSKVKNSRFYKLQISYNSFNNDSDVFMILGKEFNQDFSNIGSIKLDTLYLEMNSLESNKIDSPNKNFKGFFWEVSTKITDTINDEQVKMRIDKKKVYFNEQLRAGNEVN